MAAKRQLDYSRAAGDDLELIKRYIEADNPKAAVHVLEYITAAADGLLDFPMTGKPWRRAGSRKLVLTKYPYSIIYRVEPSKVVVLTVAHQSRKHAGRGK
ncbi:MAG: type II toxin-antitoxin system RelE/ParE family toxin [Gallionellaceae bacterium]|jgi:addiction module RelE/StbE family toxin|nr:type II toxin-antitoxin system RelE/ParE family toxin [Gallionellaceae bacterium]